LFPADLDTSIETDLENVVGLEENIDCDNSTPSSPKPTLTEDPFERLCSEGVGSSMSIQGGQNPAQLCISVDEHKPGASGDGGARTKTVPEMGLLEKFTDVTQKMTVGTLSQLSSNDLIRVHERLNNVMFNVVVALRNKCPTSPNDSQAI